MHLDHTDYGCAVRKFAGWGLALEWAVGLALVAAVFLVALVFLGPVNKVVQCDGAVPKSFIPFGYNGSGCVPVPADWFEGNSADKYADEPWVCLGMCGGLPSWDSRTGEWVETAP